MTTAVEVIHEPERAQALLSEVRLKLLEHLSTPSSAAALARLLDLPRQRLNYHLRELERQNLIQLVEERRRGNVTERIYQRTGETYVISPRTLGSLASDPDAIQDRLSCAYQIALASRTTGELATLQEGAAAAGQRLPTYSADVEVRFASAEQRSAFAEELTAAVANLVQKYHDESTPDGRAYRLYLGSYPKPKSPPTSA